MPSRDNAFPRHQRKRWLRPDAERWVREDAARFLRPGSDPSEVLPGFEQKYNQDQPRVPSGNGRESGRWTDGSGGAGSDVTQPADGIDFGDLPNFSDLFALFQITPQEFDNSDDVQLAGDPQQNGGLPASAPPEIPREKPTTSAARTSYLRAAANWLGNNAGIAADIYVGAMNNVEWLQEYHALIQADLDPPQPLEILQQGVGQRRPGYDDHHIVEQTWAEYFGFSRSEIDDPSNLVSVSRLKHYQITGWYMAPNEDFGGISPRKYLSDKNWEERRRVGLDALIRFKVLQP